LSPPSADADEILATTAHELRLPLSHIKGFVTSLRRTDIEWDDETQNEFLAEIDQETDRLADLIDSLMAVHAADRGDKAATDLAFTHTPTVVYGALQRIRGLLRDRPLRLDVSPSLPSVQMDASQMERVLANLIHNAIKYSPPGRPISVSARMTDDGDLEFSVDDEGPGIPAEDRERIFEPFFRGHTARQSDVPGDGLGLAICRRIVLAHGGHMQVTDRPGGGARFRVLLPAQLRAGEFDSNSQVRGQGDDSATRAPGGRAANPQAALQQPEGERLRRPLGCGWCGCIATQRGGPVRPAA
jgi:signal transduction histidine kinase